MTAGRPVRARTRRPDGTVPHEPAEAGESVVFDRIAHSYDETRGGLERGRVAAGVIAELLPPSGPVLEVGVGTGLVAAGLAELGRPPVGIDLSLPMLARARERLPGRLAIGDAARLPVADGSMSAVCFVHVLHLVGDLPGTLAEAVRVLAPGGVVLSTVFPADEEVSGDLHEEVRRLRRALGADERSDDEQHVVAVARTVGLLAGERRPMPGTPVTPRLAAQRLEDRSLSWMWSVDADRWERLVPAALERIRALPDPDRVRPGPGASVLAFSLTE